MSHFSYIKTRFQNLFYLEKALNRLNINSQKQRKEIEGSKGYKTNLVVSKPYGYKSEFSWKEQEYELITDVAFWKQSSEVDEFIAQVSQSYAGQVIVGESKKMGFEPLQYQENSDGSQTLILERYAI